MIRLKRQKYTMCSNIIELHIKPRRQVLMNIEWYRYWYVKFQKFA